MVELMAQKEQLLDTIGIVQHHDAVTGTAKQAVSNDYKLRISNSIASNRPVYGELVSEKLHKMTGYNTAPLV